MTPPAAPCAPAARPPSRWRDGMLWLIGGIVALVVGTNAIMIWIAVAASPNLVRRDYYDASKHVDAEQAARQASARLGWRVSEAAEARAPDAVALRIVDAAGAPVSGLQGALHAYRPADAALDQPLRWREDPAAPGLYRAGFARPAPGLWRLTLDLRRGDERLYEDLIIVMPR